MTEGVPSWDGRRVLVTGASSGIGAALARDLAAQGATVGICARRTDLLDAVLEDCRRHAPECRAWTIDLEELDALDDFAARADDELGGIETVVHNAALVVDGDATETPRDVVERLVRVDYLAPVLLTRALLPRMLARGTGQLAVVSSMAARMSTPGESAYAAAKAALSTWFEALGGEVAGDGVTVHLVYPALVDVGSDADGDDALAEAPNPATHIPAPVCARAIRRQLERGDLELYVPTSARAAVVARAEDPAASLRVMADWYAAGRPH